MLLSIIAALDTQGLIGNAGKIPWDLPEDKAYFRQLTLGHILIMGRRTAESLESPLEKRRNLVLSRSGYFREGFEVFKSLTILLESIKNSDEEVFIIGGREIYSLFLPLARKMYLTDILAAYKGDTFFPAYSMDAWREISSVSGVSRLQGTAYTFRTLVRLL